MNPGAAEFCQENISRTDDFLRSARPAGQAEHGAPVSLVHHPASRHVIILAMVHHSEIEHTSVLDRAPHHFMVLNTMTIVGDRHDAGLNHGPDRSHLFTVQTFGYRTGREDVD